MMIKFIRFIAIICCSWKLYTEYNYNNIIIPCVTIDNPYWQFAYQPIRQKEQGSFACVIDRWTDIIDDQWNIINAKIEHELGIDADQLSSYITNPIFLNFYTNYYKFQYPDFFDESPSQKIDPLVLNFIQQKLVYLGCHKNIQINHIAGKAFITSTFGSDQTQHYLIVNDDIYNKNNIDELYKAAIEQRLEYQIIPNTNFSPSLIIESSNLFHLGISQSVSSITHQSDLFVKLLHLMVYVEKQLSDDVEKYCLEYLLFLSYIESTLQSKNPVEIALYLQPRLDNFYAVFSHLWEEFIQDLQDCYHADDLQAYQLFSQEQRRAALYEKYGAK